MRASSGQFSLHPSASASSEGKRAADPQERLLSVAKAQPLPPLRVVHATVSMSQVDQRAILIRSAHRRMPPTPCRRPASRPDIPPLPPAPLAVGLAVPQRSAAEADVVVREFHEALARSSDMAVAVAAIQVLRWAARLGRQNTSIRQAMPCPPAGLTWAL